MKPSADGRSASLIIQGLDSSMHALGHNSRLAESTKSRLAGSTKKGLRRYRDLRWLLAERCCWMRSVRLENLQHAPERGANKSGWCGLGRLLRWGCIATGKVRDQQAWLLVSCVLVLAVLSREEHCSEVQCRLHVVQGCRLSATCAATNRSPLPSRYCSGRPLRAVSYTHLTLPTIYSV